MNLLKYKKTILISTTIITNIIIVPQLSFAGQQNTSNILQKQVDKQKNTLISGIIPANTFYNIKDSNGRLIAKGKSDSKGVFINHSNTILQSKSYNLNYDNEYITNNVNFDDSIILFSAPMLQSGTETAESISRAILFLSIASFSIKSYGWPIWFAAAGIFSLFAESDETIDALDNIIDSIAKIQDLTDKEFTNINQRMSDIFNKMVSNEIVESNKTLNALTLNIRTIGIILSGDNYDNFWTKYPKYKDILNIDPNKLSEDERQKLFSLATEFWQDLKSYENENNLEDISDELNIINTNLKKPNANMDNVINNVHALYQATRNTLTQEQLRSYIEGINKQTINQDITGDHGYINDICDGNTSSMIYRGYVRALLSLSNISSLLQYLKDNGFNSAYKDKEDIYKSSQQSILDLIKLSKENLNRCNFFSNPNGSGWSDITYTTITKNSKPYLFVVAPLIHYSDTSADTLAYSKQKDIRKGVFSPEQNLFFDELLNSHWKGGSEKSQILVKTRKDGVTKDYTLVAYYSLQDTSNIDNDNLIRNPEDSEVKLTYESSFNKYKIHLSGIKDDNYSLLFSDGKVINLVQNQKSVEHIFDVVQKWKISNAFNEYIILRKLKSNDSYEIIQQKNLSIQMPIKPMEQIQTNLIYTSNPFGETQKISFVRYGKELPSSIAFDKSNSTSISTFLYNGKEETYNNKVYRGDDKYIDFITPTLPKIETTTYSIALKSGTAVSQSVTYKCNGLVSCEDAIAKWENPKITKYAF